MGRKKVMGEPSDRVLLLEKKHQLGAEERT